MSLEELAARVRNGKLSATRLVTLALERIADRDGQLGAVVATCPDEALARAAALDAARGAGTSPPLRLAGLPILVKDSQDVEGLRTTHGSWLFADKPPARTTSLSPARLQAAGAVVVGKTNVPELCSEGFTDNRVFGSTANPWVPAWNAGGSSGGSAAALAAGLCAAATASDGGGSTRIPAAACGLLGLKPTSGLVGREPIPAWMDLSTDGVLAQSAADATTLLSVLQGPVEGDFLSVPAPMREAVSLRRVVAFPRFSIGPALPDDVDTAFWPAVEELAAVLRLPLERREALITSKLDPDRDWFVMTSCEQAWELGEATVHGRGSDMDPLVLSYMLRGLQTPVGEYLAARRRRFEYARAVDAAVRGGAVLVTPTTTVNVLRDGTLPGRSVRGSHVSGFNTMIHNLTGHPALSIPAGYLATGLPFGIQVTAARWRDVDLLHIAERWQQAHPWPLTATGYEPFDV